MLEAATASRETQHSGCLLEGTATTLCLPWSARPEERAWQSTAISTRCGHGRRKKQRPRWCRSSRSSRSSLNRL